MAREKEWFFTLFGICCCIKLLLLPAYRSTDFEVHRNWLAITHSLPVSDWYYEETSQWTLDYPPFFAWFEYLLSQVAEFFDKDMLIVTNLEYGSRATVVFQRLSVIFTDSMLIYAVYRYIVCNLQGFRKEPLATSKVFILTSLLLFNFGLFVVDHIHFQYNGFLFGILLLSIQKTTAGSIPHGAFLFAVLLNFKHIFLYIAPAYFVYLLREFCFRNTRKSSRMANLIGVDIFDLMISRLIGLGLIVSSVFLVSFGPFVYMGDLKQVLSRLFPVKRGLCHAYWAANFWSLYNLADKFLAIAGSKLGLHISSTSQASMTGGLVAQQEHLVLPSVSALATAILTLATMLPSLLNIWYRPSGPKGFLRCLIICAYCSFLFGYHVHEKAVIMIIIPMCLLAVESKSDCRAFILLSVPGHFALFPLLYQPFETPLKVTLFLAYTVLSLAFLAKLHRCEISSFGLPFLNRIEALYIWGLVPLYIYCNAVHSMIGLSEKLPFVPLMLTSVYCTIGILCSWGVFYFKSMNFTTKDIKVS
ncbi:probable dolichyl pyrophosphate Glc1Man9GlcNAc2 alpha-1,3-glucosyltransferase [Rhopilema esculentum]|uniref:probable dolichyl pyrophosphate Glc1Man9GlcNAc2 alpha-1,3-glucosyltransferase n=1 Tax=Rhopilema esculentum TaxID=499914 RepID=UPI0031D92FC0